MYKIRTALAALLFILVWPAWADFDAGLAAYHRGDFATALKEWLPLT